VRRGTNPLLTIKLLNFGFLIPASVTVGIGLLRGAPGAIRAAYGLCGFFTCLAASVAGMAVVMEVNGDPSAHPSVLAILVPVTLGPGVVTTR